MTRLLFLEINLYTGSVEDVKQLENDNRPLKDQLDDYLMSESEWEQVPSSNPYYQIHQTKTSVTFQGEEGSFQLLLVDL